MHCKLLIAGNGFKKKKLELERLEEMNENILHDKMQVRERAMGDGT